MVVGYSASTLQFISVSKALLLHNVQVLSNAAEPQKSTYRVSIQGSHTGYPYRVLNTTLTRHVDSKHTLHATELHSLCSSEGR